MSNLQDLRRRVGECARRLDELQPLGPGEPGAPDPATGERWDRFHVLGHVGEMLPFWTGEMRRLLEGAGEVGRDDDGYIRREAAIASAAEADEAELLHAARSGTAGLVALLDDLSESDLSRVALRRSREGERESTLGDQLEQALVGHLEEHVAQLEGRSPASA